MNDIIAPSNSGGEPTDWTVRAADEGDLDTLVAFTLAQALASEGLALDPDTVRRGVRAGLADTDRARYWVAQAPHGQLVGSLWVHPEWSDWHDGVYWWVESVFVAEAQRGRGVIEALMAAVRQAADDEGALSVKLYVHQGNERALRAYRRLGFEASDHRLMVLKLRKSEPQNRRL
jgi:GNAT superfamily N-acetyltransferase